MPKVVTIAGESFNYFEKAEWGSRVTSPPLDPISDGPEPQGYLHHEGSSNSNPTVTRPLTVEEEKARMRAWQDYCIDRAGQGWSDIPYNIGVFPFSGNVYEARGWRSKSGATAGQNEDSKAVCIVANIVPTALGIPQALNSAALVFVWGMAIDEIAKDAQILGHWENPKHYKETTCPGYVDMNLFREQCKTKFHLQFDPKPPPIPIPTPVPEPIPTPPQGGDIVIVLAAPLASNARFLATSDSRGFISNMCWIDNEEEFKKLQRYYPVRDIEADATKNIALIGPLPKGDSLRNWTWDDFLNAPPS